MAFYPTPKILHNPSIFKMLIPASTYGFIFPWLQGFLVLKPPEKAQTDSVHFPEGTTYQIPMRSLLVEKPENLVIAGRCISATHEAMAAFRVTPIAMAIGQAAGVIAAKAVSTRVLPARIDYSLVRDELIAQGAKLPEVRNN